MSVLIVGLGNPGREYEETRHNMGFMLLDNLSFSSTLNWKEKYKGIYAKTNIAGKEVHLLKPQTYMNLSGESVQKAASFLKLSRAIFLLFMMNLTYPMVR